VDVLGIQIHLRINVDVEDIIQHFLVALNVEVPISVLLGHVRLGGWIVVYLGVVVPKKKDVLQRQNVLGHALGVAMNL
jgi:hypothetical protein